MSNVLTRGLVAVTMVAATAGTVGIATSAEAAPSTSTASSTVQTAQVQAAGGCVSKKEFRRAKKGMTPGKVARIFGTKGTKESVVKRNGRTIMARGYRGCPQYSAVGVAFIKKSGTFRLANKVASWNM